MGRYADNFEAACPLDSLSWVTMPPIARTRALAARFLREEDKLKRLKEKGEWEVTAGVVKPWLLSVYEPPRGQLSGLMTDLLAEIERQRGIRRKRAENRPWKWKKSERSDRLSRVSRSLYGIVTRSHDKKLVRLTSTRCSNLSTVSGILMALDITSEANIRVYMRHRETGRVKVVITDVMADYRSEEQWPLTKVLLRLAPTIVERALFGGHLVAVDFDRDGFTVDGVFHPYRHVVKVVEGHKMVMRTRQKVEKPKTEDKATEESNDDEE